MALLETLTLEVGPAVAKSILKLWLKDAGAAADASASLVDVLKSKTGDVIAQQKAKRQFEAIGENVAQSLLPAFEDEGRELDEGGKSAVARAVANTLNGAKVDAGLLASRNLDPTELTKYFLSVEPEAARDLSISETALHRRIISESSRLIVDIAAQLPAFTERTFSEVLKREDSLLTTTNLILEEVRRIREGSRDLEREAARFETEYRSSVIRNLDRLELFGVDVSTPSRRHRLSVAYVSLSVQHRTASTDRADMPYDLRFDLAQEQMILERTPLTVVPNASALPTSINQALARSRRLLVRSLAGSGKTTLLQWIAVRSAARDFPTELAEWNETIPFFIRLREYAETDLPAPEFLPRSVAPAITDTMPHGWVHEQLKSGRAIVLVDGVDELPEKRRFEVRRWLEGLVGTFPNARYLITSRPYAVTDDWLAELGFDHGELQPLGLAAIDDFIDHWHNAVKAELSDPVQLLELEALPSNLKITLRRNRPIRSLATSPLLCAMLCALHRDRHRQLPSDRIELYEAGCYMLLERREIERNIPMDDYPTLTYRQKRALLQDLAYWMMQNGWAEVERPRAEEHLSKRLANMDGVSKDKGASGVYRLFVERSGLVGEPVANRMDFTHRTLQEFLTAQAILDEDSIGFLVKNAHDDQWREVVILAAGLASTKTGKELLNALITRGDREAQHSHRLYLLAVACLETSVELSPDVRIKVQRRIAPLLPPENMEEAKALSSAGDLAVPYLVCQPDQAESTAVTCVHTLGLIGSDEALDALQGYVNDTRQNVIDELFHAWEAFDRRIYAERILGSIRQLKLSRATTLEGFEFLTGLEELTIGDCRAIHTLGPLANLTGLVKLDLGKYEEDGATSFTLYEVTDLSPLSNLVDLRELTLWDCRKVNDIGPLSSLKHLTYLRVYGPELIDDLASFGSLGELTKLYLSHSVFFFNYNAEPGLAASTDYLAPLANLVKLTDLSIATRLQISNLDPLSALTNLEALSISQFQGDALTPLECLTQLRRLALAGPGELVDLSALAGLTQLEELNLQRFSKLSDLSPLRNLTKLKGLYLYTCSEIRDLRPLNSLTDLENLSLYSCTEIRDIQPLARLVGLKNLSVDFAQIQDLGSLAGLVGLEYLTISFCAQVHDLRPLGELRNLKYLSLSYCTGIHDLSPLVSLTNLEDLSLRGCSQVLDLSPLRKLGKLKFSSFDLDGVSPPVKFWWQLRGGTIKK